MFGSNDEVNIPGETTIADHSNEIESSTKPGSLKVESEEESTDTTVGVQGLGSFGLPMAARTIGFVAEMLSRGTRRLRNTIDDGTELTKKALTTVDGFKNATIDAVQDTFNENSIKTLNRIASWTETLDHHRKALSGQGLSASGVYGFVSSLL